MLQVSAGRGAWCVVWCAPVCVEVTECALRDGKRDENLGASRDLLCVGGTVLEGILGTATQPRVKTNVVHNTPLIGNLPLYKRACTKSNSNNSRWPAT